MTTQSQYSTLFSCLYDQPAELGIIGRGTHYSLFRSVQWRTINGESDGSGVVHHFAVIWDEDHDTRVIGVIERMHLDGLLWPVIFIGERKGGLSVVVDRNAPVGPAYIKAVEAICSNADGDCWPCELGWFERSSSGRQTEPAYLIQSNEADAVDYLHGIDATWRLGNQPTFRKSLEYVSPEQHEAAMRELFGQITTIK